MSLALKCARKKTVRLSICDLQNRYSLSDKVVSQIVRLMRSDGDGLSAAIVLLAFEALFRFQSEAATMHVGTDADAATLQAGVSAAIWIS